MEKLKLKAYYLAVFVCLVILVIAGSYFVYYTYHPGEDLRQNVPGSTLDPGSGCDPQVASSRVLVPVDTSISVRDTMPGIRYSLNESDSGMTIVLGKGDIVEINLRWIPSLSLRWVIPVSGCGLELVNDRYYDTGTDFWNTSGHYRVRYRAVSPGTSVLDGKFVDFPDDIGKGAPRFNLTVIVK
jgi:predicted secreted protein